MSDRFHELVRDLAAYRAGRPIEPGFDAARHEAGHTLVAYRLELPGLFVTMAQSSYAQGDPHTHAEPRTPVEDAAMAWGALIVDGRFGPWSEHDLARLGPAELDRHEPTEGFTIAEEIIAAAGADVDRLAEAIRTQGADDALGPEEIAAALS